LGRNADDVHFTAYADLSNATGGVFYKYGIYDVDKQAFIGYEGGQNRVLTDLGGKDAQVIVNDAFAVFETTTWKGAGIAIPVFSLRSQQSFGVGEFTDIALLVDWAKATGMKLIQLLPVNDTTATHSWHDSYPYAAISAFALHPLYVNVLQMADKANKAMVQEYDARRIELNNQEFLDYQPVMELKLDIARKLYDLQKKKTFTAKDYKQFFEQNKHWLVPYAVFCHLRDTYSTADFNAWPAYTQYKTEEIAALIATGSADYDSVAFHYFVQYHLHLQLKAAKQYAHQQGVIIKGDIAIGIYRYGVDAWQQPELYHMHLQAGAPPDDFAVKGQNWGFPTYNWQRMKEDGFAWWKQRFEQMSEYFDAFRIDHILGFFRIWSIPMHAVEGIMGHFVPAIPVHRNEFDEKGIWFDYHRFTKPFINDAVLWEVFGYDADFVKEQFLTYDGFGNYTLKPEFATQRLVEKHFTTWETNDFNERIKIGLYNLISNVILFEVEGSQGQQFHFRFAIASTTSYKHLDGHLQQQLSDLYVDYFFRRQDDFWEKEAMQKLPALKRVTNMLVCGEDLGLVPDCVPGVMKQLGLLSLEIQRMPKDPTKTFFHPADAPYLSVVTPSTHDMSIIRGWWEEDRTRTQDFYNNQLGQWGQAPYFCEPWVNKLIIDQHLYSPAMWSIFQLQDLLGIDGNLRRENPEDERINVPANPKHFWKYRMNLTLESLLQQTDFNTLLHNSIVASGRN
jgi:4-alpha-glucanotransferase